MSILIQTRKDELTEGIYGQGLMWVLEVIKDLEDTRLINSSTKVAFDIDSVPYGQFIPRFVVPKNPQVVDRNDFTSMINTIRVIDHKRKRGTYAEFPFEMASFDKANSVFNRWFSFSPEVLSKIPTISKDTLGLHYRGTDKNIDNAQANPIFIQEFISIVEDYLKNNPNITSIFCCSDEREFIDKIQMSSVILSRGITIIQHNQPRATDNLQRGFFRVGGNVNDDIRDQLTIASLVDMLSLSRCNTVLKTSSALSSFCKIINPEQQVFTVSAMKQRWFPAGVVKPYSSNDPKINSILERTLEGHLYKPQNIKELLPPTPTPTPTPTHSSNEIVKVLETKMDKTKYLNAIWINIDKYEDRSRFMKDQFSNCGWNNNYRVSAITLDTVDNTVADEDYVDGSLEYCCDPSQKFFPDCKNCKVERATLTSHMKAIEKGLSISDPNGWFIVFEDDTVIPLSIDYQMIIDYAPEDAECLQLFCSNPITTKKLYEIYKKNRVLWTKWKMIIPSASGYIMSNTGAKKILNAYKKDENKYSFNSTSSCRLADVMIYETLTTYTMTYPMFYPNIDLGSIIHPDHLASHAIGRDVIKEIIESDPPTLFLTKK